MPHPMKPVSLSPEEKSINAQIVKAWREKFALARERSEADDYGVGKVSFESKYAADKNKPITILVQDNHIWVQNLSRKAFDRMGALIYSAIYKAWPEAMSYSLHPEIEPGEVAVVVNHFPKE